MVRSRFSRSLRTVAGEAASLARRVRPAPSGCVRVLYYHRIDDEQHRSCVRPQAFSAQMRHLRSEGYEILSLADLHRHIEGKVPFPERAVAVTFDDGFADNYYNAFPILQKESVPMTLFLTTAFIGTHELPVLRDRSGIPPLNWEQVGEMARHGVDLGAHTLSHPNLTELDDPSLEGEIAGCRVQIKEHTGIETRWFCYPRGDFDERVRNVVQRSGYDLSCTTREGVVSLDTDPHTLRRTFIANDDSLRDFNHKLQGSFDLLHEASDWLRGTNTHDVAN